MKYNAFQENANSIIINFTENPKEEIKDEIVQSDVIQEEIQDTSNEIDLESDFDIEKTLNENWDKIDDNTEEVSKKNIEQDNSISELQEEIENLRK
mgnify:CR=1 FL=1